MYRILPKLTQVERHSHYRHPLKLKKTASDKTRPQQLQGPSYSSSPPPQTRKSGTSACPRNCKAWGPSAPNKHQVYNIAGINEASTPLHSMLPPLFSRRLWHTTFKPSCLSGAHPEPWWVPTRPAVQTAPATSCSARSNRRTPRRTLDPTPTCPHRTSSKLAPRTRTSSKERWSGQRTAANGQSTSTGGGGVVRFSRVFGRGCNIRLCRGPVRRHPRKRALLYCTVLYGKQAGSKPPQAKRKTSSSRQARRVL